MKNHAPEFIRNRIEWRARQHGLPSSWTRGWEEVPEEFKGLLPAGFVEPVLFSVASTGGLLVIGVDEILVAGDSGVLRVDLDEILLVSSAAESDGNPKLEADRLIIQTGRLGEVLFRVEMGKPCFAIQSILMTLVQLQRPGTG